MLLKMERNINKQVSVVEIWLYIPTTEQAELQLLHSFQSVYHFCISSKISLLYSEVSVISFWKPFGLR